MGMASDLPRLRGLMRQATHSMKHVVCCLLLIAGTALSPHLLAKSSDWQEFTSQHFTVYSDRKTSEARALLEDFERFRTAALTITGLPSVDESQRPQIFLFRLN